MAGIALPQQLEAPIKGTSLWRDAARRLIRNPAALVGFFLVFSFVFVAVFAPLISPYSPTVGTIDNKFLAPSTAHVLGTDLQGRDILSRILWGARSSLWVSVLSVTVGLSIGLTYGSISGYLGGWFDFWMMRVVDIVPPGPAAHHHDRPLPWARSEHDRVCHRDRERAHLRPAGAIEHPGAQGE